MCRHLHPRSELQELSHLVSLCWARQSPPEPAFPSPVFAGDWSGTSGFRWVPVCCCRWQPSGQLILVDEHVKGGGPYPTTCHFPVGSAMSSIHGDGDGDCDDHHDQGHHDNASDNANDNNEQPQPQPIPTYPQYEEDTYIYTYAYIHMCIHTVL